MNHRERVIAALEHRTPDRCPMQISFTPEFAVRLCAELGLQGDALHNPHGGGNTYALELALGEDMLLTSVGWANCYYQEGDAYVDEWGVGWRSMPYQTPFGPGRYTEPVGHPLADPAAIDSYRAPDPERPELYAEAERLLRNHQHDHWIVGVTVTTIFETAWALRGYEQLMMDFAQDPALADAVLEIPYRYHLAAAERLARLGVDMLWLGDDVGTQTSLLISPRHWRRFLMPRMHELIRRVRAIRPGIKIAYHSDGAIGKLVPELIEVGIDVLNPIQPGPLDPAQLVRDYGDRLCFWGSIDEQHTLPFGTPEGVRAEVLERLRVLGRDGGLILGPTHHVQLDTPMANFRAMVDAITGTPCADLA